MAKIANLQEVAVSELVPYERNAKMHGKDQIEKLKASIEAFGFLTPCLIDREKNLIAGHGRVMAAKELGLQTIPCVLIEDLTEAERRAYILADNRLSELGEWNMDLVYEEIGRLASEQFEVDITGFDIPGFSPDFDQWNENRIKNDRSRQEGNDEYNEFLDKFEEAKTTDDCYTPENIYEVIAKYVESKYGKKRENFVRPFFPGGDYQGYEYEQGAVVVDNPPFSILSEIIDFYVDKQIQFFLFAPGLSTISYTNRSGVASLCVYAGITYENGACVTTSFVTNLEDPEIVALNDPDLYDEITEKNKENEDKYHHHFDKYEYPAEVVTAAKLGYLSRYGQRLVIKRKDAYFIRSLDAQKESGKGIFGSALLLSEKAAAEKAAAEKAAAEKAAAEKAAAIKWPLSEREQEIVRSLG